MKQQSIYFKAWEQIKRDELLFRAMHATTQSIVDGNCRTHFDFLNSVWYVKDYIFNDFENKFSELVLKSFVRGKTLKETSESMSTMWGDGCDQAIDKLFGSDFDMFDLDEDDKARVRNYVDKTLSISSGENHSLPHIVNGDLKELGYTAGEADYYMRQILPRMIIGKAQDVKLWRNKCMPKKQSITKNDNVITEKRTHPFRKAFILTL